MEQPDVSAPGDSRFYALTGPHDLPTVAHAANGSAVRDDGRRLARLAPLTTAGPADVTYCDGKRAFGELGVSRAGAVLIAPANAALVPAATVAILCAEPAAGWIGVAALFHPPPPLRSGAHPSAVVDPSARIDADAEIGPLATIGPGVEVGARCRIGSGAALGAHVVLGPDCRVGANASISHAILGARVVIHPGARIGQEGFSLIAAGGGFRTMPQLGRVVIGDDVEIGANSTIDRGALTDTVIGAGSRLDNLVQIGHNVRLGRGCVVVSQAGISGSTVLGDFVTIGGQAGITGHLQIGRGARIGAQAGVMTDWPDGAEVVGSPAQPVRVFFRQIALLKRLAGKGRDGSNRQSGAEGTG